MARPSRPSRRLEIPGRPRPWIMAHRGASDLAPENSMCSFELAVEHGADLLETDLWLTADGEIVCHHDATLQRMTGDPRPVTAVTRDELQALRLRDAAGQVTEQGIPSLAQLVAQTPETVAIMLEIKDARLASPNAASALARVVASRLEAGTVGVIGFDLGVLMALRDAIPGLVTGHITKYRVFPSQPTELLGPYYPLLFLNPRYVAMAHRRGQRVCPLDPGLHTRLQRYLDMDVDAVLTNDPRATRQRIEALRGNINAGS